jgi:hypothetical protein
MSGLSARRRVDIILSHVLPHSRPAVVELASGKVNVPKVMPLLINGVWLESKATQFVDVLNPATQEVVTRVPLATPQELAAAAQAAAVAFQTWKDVPVSTRQRYMFKLQELVRRHEDELVEAIVMENGKTIADAKGDIFRGLEVIETACNVGTAMMGETVDNVARDVDTYSLRQPLGVVGGAFACSDETGHPCQGCVTCLYVDVDAHVCLRLTIGRFVCVPTLLQASVHSIFRP